MQLITANNNIITGNNAPEGSIVYYFLLTYVKSDYENNFWGDINPNSTKWFEEFVTRKYTDPAPKTWLEELPQYPFENISSKNESFYETNSFHQNSTSEKTKNEVMSDKKVSLNQISVNEIPLNNLVDEMSAGHMSSYGLDSKSAAYLTKKIPLLIILIQQIT